MSEIEKILEAASGNSLHVSEEMLPLVYDELRSLATKRMSGQAPGQTIQATALVHEAWLRLTANADKKWNDRAHFFRAAAIAMRHILVNRARAKSSLKRGSDRPKLDISTLEVADTAQEDRILDVDEALVSLEKEDPDSARVVTLKFFGGLTNKEIAAMDEVAERTIERKWAYARSRLYQIITERC
ncbi:RNA polymerase sigma-70 family factor [Haloferula helveola]|uniref:RNA polymerase sigma-70 family factor n=1 Tax=Haloferula helveola TaxID=490095 RepID=A0ABM7RDU9_9BACT|nr:RNA polymerase sigma-70 family factor [Haloferula helveola]